MSNVSTSFRDVLEAMNYVNQMQKEYDNEANRLFESGNRSGAYWLTDERDALDTAREQLEAAMEKYVQERVNAALAARAAE